MYATELLKPRLHEHFLFFGWLELLKLATYHLIHKDAHSLTCDNMPVSEPGNTKQPVSVTLASHSTRQRVYDLIQHEPMPFDKTDSRDDIDNSTHHECLHWSKVRRLAVLVLYVHDLAVQGVGAANSKHAAIRADSHCMYAASRMATTGHEELF